MIPESFIDDIYGLLTRCREEGLSDKDYKVFNIKTKNKIRQICEPKEALKKFQKDTAKVFDTLPTSESCFSKPGCSIVDNALPHINSEIIYKTDIANFYPSIEKPHFWNGYAYIEGAENFNVTCMLTELIDLCYTPYVTGLPIGAPTSPSTSNIAMYRVDKRLSDLSKDNEYTYTRYFDDLTFSKQGCTTIDNYFSEEITQVLIQSGFRIREDKSKWVFPNTHEAYEVTGINIGNGKSTVPRSIKRLVRVMLDRKAKGILETEEILNGYLAYINMVDKEYRDKLDNYFQERCNHHGLKHT